MPVDEASGRAPSSMRFIQLMRILSDGSERPQVQHTLEGDCLGYDHLDLEHITRYLDFRSAL